MLYMTKVSRELVVGRLVDRDGKTHTACAYLDVAPDVDEEDFDVAERVGTYGGVVYYFDALEPGTHVLVESQDAYGLTVRVPSRQGDIKWGERFESGGPLMRVHRGLVEGIGQLEPG